MLKTTAEYRPLIRDLPTEERPRERLRLRGPGALSNAELLAILLRTGSAGENVVSLATRLLARFEGLPGLAQTGFTQLCSERHVGEAKASQLLAALELGRRVVSTQPDQRTEIRSAEDVWSLVGAEMALLEQEELRVILLNTRSQVMGVEEIYRGGVHSVVVRIADIFRDAVRENCPSIIVVHNHPSGDPNPSGEDLSLTKQLIDVGTLLGIEVLDHVVIGRGAPVSLKALGVMQ